uniref:aldo/keto reductase n=1 Tax=Streptomyces koyangensis TaxID=188770 RepID=UPI003D04EF9E
SCGRWQDDAMDERTFDRTDQHASVIGLGTWQLGADWGDVDDKQAHAVLEAAAEFAALAPEGYTPAQLALRWIIQQPGVTTVIPGARSPEQARANAAAARLPELSPETLAAIDDLYDRRVREQVEGRW